MEAAAHADLTDGQGRRRLVRNGHAPERHLQTGIGPIAVSRPRVRDRGGHGSEPIRFTSAVLPMIGGADHPAAGQERRGTPALALPQGRLYRAVRGGPDRAPRARRAGAVGGDGPAPHRGLAGGARALAGTRPAGPPLCLPLGRRGSTSSRGSTYPTVTVQGSAFTIPMLVLHLASRPKVGISIRAQIIGRDDGIITAMSFAPYPCLD